MAYYIPIMLDCEGLPVLVIGGGEIAARKCAPLVGAGASVTVLSPELCAELAEFETAGRISWLKREYAEGDVAGLQAGLVYACTNDKDVNAAAGAEAKRLHIPVNVVSAAKQGSFITPNIIRRGGLVISVSASGAGPLISRNMTRELEQRCGEEYELYTALAAAVRDRVKRSVDDAEKRRKLLRSFAKLNLLEQIRSGTFRPWTDEQIDEWIVKG